jgi:hypothetical protein
MAIDMKDTIEILNKIRDTLKRKQTTLELKGPGVAFEKIQYGEEMMGDQLLGHPSMKEIELIRNK